MTQTSLAKEPAVPSCLPFDRPFERIFEEFWRGPFAFPPRTDGFAPSVDVYEDKEGYAVELEVPGLTEKEIQVELDGNLLTVRGEKKWETKEKEKGRDYHRVERRYGAFCRQVALPDSVDPSTSKAQCKNRVLTIRFSKRPEARKKAIRIEVK